ncbi:MAG: adenylate/guanylate cyclase domain-containing protein [Candidatus Kerfeldbacteria bacterium]
MGLSDDLKAEVAKIFRERWTERDGNKVPESQDLGLANDAVKLNGTVLYSDLDSSTDLVARHKPQFAAEVYKTFLHCAAKIIRNEGGAVTAYDGDRVMAVFIGDTMNTDAARAALRINWARIFVINPAIKAQYATSTYQLRHVTAVDTSPLFVARTGVRGANDLVWVGPAANRAAKLSTLSADYPSRITADVYNKMLDGSKYGPHGEPMWESATWNGEVIYRSTWHWGPG